MNTTLFFILHYLYGSIDDYVTKELLVEAICLSNKCHCIEKVPQGMSTITWLRLVQDYGYVFVNIETKTATTPRAKSRSVLKFKLESLEMRAHPKDADIEKILVDIPSIDQNRHPSEKQYSIQCPSFELGNCTNTFYVENQLFDLRPINSDGTINHMSVHQSNHFKELYDTKKIPHLVLKMAGNHH